MPLPRFVVLKSNYNNKYLRYIHEDVQVYGLLKFTGEEVVSPYGKFEVEMAEDGLVHIRCCYNNKYWVRWTKNHWWIVAGADEPEKDQSKWSCTLFRPIWVDETARTIRFLHVQLGHYACLWRIAAPFDSCLFSSSENPNNDSCDVCTIIDLESLMIMPKHVAFKGDNGQYLSARLIDGYQYLQFEPNDVGGQTIGNEIFTTCDGSIRVKSDQLGKFWRRRSNSNWICVDSVDTTNNNPETLFWPIKVGNNAVALRNLGNNNFCKRHSTENRTNCLNAGMSAVARRGQIEVEELVISRKIDNVNFRLLDARFYNQRGFTMATGVATNMTQETNDAEVKLSYQEAKSSSWNSSVSLKLGVETHLQTDIPFSADGGNIEISRTFSEAYQWGQTRTSSTVEDRVYEVTVPAMTIMTVTLRATLGSCDIPFSYTQHDTLTQERQVTYNMDDGIYTGINFFNFKYETKEETL